MKAHEALTIVQKNNERERALAKRIDHLENRIKAHAERGHRSCIADFYYYTLNGGYNFEIEIKEYFIKNGFTFKRITDDVCGGVRQAPYWIICW